MWRDFWANYWRRAAGTAAGLLFGIVYLAFGFWDMLFVALLVSAGYWYGKQKEQSSGPVFPLQKLWETLLDRFRPFK